MSVQAFAFERVAARPTRPLARALVAALFLVLVVLLFAVSSGVLWNLGINYNGVTGAIASKIHPATYLAFATFGLLMLARRNPASFFVTLVTKHPGTLAFLLATLLVGGVIVLDGRKGIATIFDTYLLAIIVALIAAEMETRDFTRAEKLIHVLLAANALLGLAEYALNIRVFPFRFDGVPLEWDYRSNALLGHPLENAQITGLYIMVLLNGGGASMPKSLRPAAILLQLAALVPFGGRTALLLTVAMAALWMAPRVLQVLRGARVSLPVFAAIAVLAPLLTLGVGLIAAGGFFDVITDRFDDDGGSARARVEMFAIFDHLSAHEIFIGASSDVIDSLRTSRGLEQGIENPVIRLLLYQGVVFTTFLIAGFTLFLVEIARRLRPGYGMAMIFFLVIISSYESIANKTVGLAQFVVLLLAMFPKAKET
ncbi:MAG TPA: VpsF family polysaccharide biosynthesis protein [Xanthobacteraceae bacterium]|nr:VpsF family polysaccharide biosynthesis protein [Xanthobacteraceae bacterium]